MKLLPDNIQTELTDRINASEHPRELVVDVMMAFQKALGFFSDDAVSAAAAMLGMSPLEIEELATFYNYIYREPVGKYVIHVCDSVICWMEGYVPLREYLCRKLNIDMGETTPDGRFTLLPACCLGYCDRAPVMMINKKVYGLLTPEKIDEILNTIDEKA